MHLGVNSRKYFENLKRKLTSQTLNNILVVFFLYRNILSVNYYQGFLTEWIFITCPEKLLVKAAFSSIHKLIVTSCGQFWLWNHIHKQTENALFFIPIIPNFSFHFQILYYAYLLHKSSFFAIKLRKWYH